MKTILFVPISEISQEPLNPEPLATLCQLRFLDVNAFLDLDELHILEHSPESGTEGDIFSNLPSPYAAISYPWRDLQLSDGQSCPNFAVEGALHADPISIDVLRTACVGARLYGCDLLWLDRLCILQRSREDKIWQIRHMFRVYKHCSVCLVFPGGLVRLARLDDSTTWIDRAWTLQEAAAPGAERVKIIFQLSHPSYQAYLEHRCDVENYPDAYRRFVISPATTPASFDGKTGASGQYGSLVEKVLEADSSAASDFRALAHALLGMHAALRYHCPQLIHNHEKLPIRILRAVETRMLSRAFRFRGDGFYFWVAAYTRTSSRPVGMVFSLMDLLGVQVDVSQFEEHDRTKATIAMIQLIMNSQPKAVARWLYVAPGMTPSRELSILPQAPETSESGRAYISTAQKEHVLAYRAIGSGVNWSSEGAPRGKMTDSGYFVFWSKAALVSKEDTAGLPHHHYDNHETWAIIVGRLKNLNRNPDTWRIQASSPNVKPEGVYELTFMFAEKHGYELYHRVGMEREVDERQTIGWKWQYRCFQVGGPGRGERKRFGVSTSGPILQAELGDEEDVLVHSDPAPR